VQGYIYPNEYELQWSLLIVLYPYLTGLVAGAFILASLERVFNVREVQPTYRLALLTALAFLIVAPLPLQAHLGHPGRSFEIFTRRTAPAMAMFISCTPVPDGGPAARDLVRLPADIVQWARQATGWRRWMYYGLTLGATDLSERSVSFDESAGRWLTIIGIPSAFLLHGYVGFIFGSIKANPWWSSVLMPVVFLFSAIVSGIALVLVLYMLTTMFRWQKIDMTCLDKLGQFLFYALIVDASLESLDFIHRLYEAEESIDILSQLVQNRLFLSLIVLQLLLGTLIPLIMLGVTSPALRKGGFVRVSPELRQLIYLVSAVLIQIGIFSIRWNVVIGGQCSPRACGSHCPQGGAGDRGAVDDLASDSPLVILWVLVKVLPSWTEKAAGEPGLRGPGPGPRSARGTPGGEHSGDLREATLNSSMLPGSQPRARSWRPAARRRPGVRERLVGPVLALGVGLAALGIAELVLQVTAPVPDPYVELKVRRAVNQYLRSGFPPHLTLRTDVEPGLPGMRGPSRFTTNNLGFRGDSLTVPKPVGEFRVFLLGASITECLYLDDTLALNAVAARAAASHGRRTRARARAGRSAPLRRSRRCSCTDRALSRSHRRLRGHQRPQRRHLRP
jgi:Ni/Fe-hydrogenase subunit HybB-like protein